MIFRNHSKAANLMEKKFSSKPIAIRLVFEGEDVRGEIHPLPRICTAIEKARNSFVLPCSSLSCPVAKFVLRGDGKEEIADKLFKEGLVSSEKAAKKLVSSIRHFKENVIGLRLSPLEKARFEPDVVVFALKPADAMRIAHALAFEGTPIHAEFNGITAACSEIIAIPIKEVRPNLSLGCRGSRKFFKEDEILLSIPYSMISSLEVF